MTELPLKDWFNDMRLRWLNFAVLAMLWFCCATQLFAQSRSDAPPPAAKSYILQYTLTLLCIGLGVYVACRPGKRGKKIKLERSEEEA
jgi:hypothetical protein